MGVSLKPSDARALILLLFIVHILWWHQLLYEVH